MIKIKTRNILSIKTYSDELFQHKYLSKEKMVLEDESYITRKIDSANSKGEWNYYNKNNKFIRKISINEDPFSGIIPESGDEEDDQYGVIYTAEVDITYNDFEKENLNPIMLQKVQKIIHEKLNKNITLVNLEKGLKRFFQKTIEQEEKGWCNNNLWLPYDICDFFNSLNIMNARRSDTFKEYLNNNLEEIYHLSMEE